VTAGRALLRDDLATPLRAALHPDRATARAAWEHWRRTADLVEIDPAALRIAGLLADRLTALGAGIVLERRVHGGNWTLRERERLHADHLRAARAAILARRAE
jgi:hypothetical protein